jgi:hypothetical protein
MAPAENPEQAAQELLCLATERFGNLSAAEAKLLCAAPKGEQAVCGPSDKRNDPSNDPAKADAWGHERRVRAEVIRWLCIRPEAAGRVDPQGIQLLGARVAGPLDLSFATVPFPLGLFQCRVADEVNLMSARLPALYLDGSWTGPMTADGVIVAGSILLREGFTAEGEVRLLHADIHGNLECSGGRFKNPPRRGLPESGAALSADGANVSGDVFLREGFTAEGEVRLLGAQIRGSLDCRGGVFKNPPQEELPESGTALSADAVNVSGDVLFREGFTAEGEVRLPGARIGGRLSCSGGTFKNPWQSGSPKSGRALYAEEMKVGGAAFLCREDGDGGKKFAAEGEVWLLGAQIGGDLECGGGTFSNPPRGRGVGGSGDALVADAAEVKGNVFLHKGFTAKGEVRLAGAQIKGQLSCSGGTFNNPPQEGLPESGTALNAGGVNVSGDVFLHEGFTAEGDVLLLGVQTAGDLDCRGGSFSFLVAQGATVGRHLVLRYLRHAENAKIDLGNSSTDALFDDEASWPGAGNLRLDGFVYGRISEGPTDAETRLRWLALQPWFTPQPYRQLAKVLREMGDDRGARRVLYEMEMLRRREQSRIWRKRIGSEKLSRLTRLAGSVRYGLVRVWGWLLKATIGYGFRLQRTLYWLIGLTVCGAALFCLGYLGGAMAPTEREAYACFQKQGWPPRHYQQFNPLVYSLENSVPLLRLGQDSAWAPDPGPREQEYPGAVNFAPFKWLARVAARWHFSWLAPPWFLRLFRWGQIILGWVLATLFVAGVTGVVRRE